MNLKKKLYLISISQKNMCTLILYTENIVTKYIKCY